MGDFLFEWSSAISVPFADEASVSFDDLREHIASARSRLAAGGRLPSEIAVDKTSLAVLLVAQAETGTSELDEAVSLLDEVLERHPLDPVSRTAAEVVLANALLERNGRSGDDDDVARALRYVSSPIDATLPEPLSTVRNSLQGAALLRRWDRHSHREDLFEAIAIYRSCIARPVEPTVRAAISNNLSAALALSYTVTGEPSELDQALDLITEALAALDHTGPAVQGPRRRARATQVLLLATRWRYFRDPLDMQQAQAAINELTSEVVGRVGLTRAEALLIAASLHVDIARADNDAGESDLAVSVYARAVALVEPLTPLHDLASSGYANARALRFELTGDSEDIEAALAVIRRVAGRGGPTAIHEHNLAVLLAGRYAVSDDPDDLDAALVHHERALAVAEPAGADFDLVLTRAALTYSQRYAELADETDLERVFELLDRAARLPGVTLQRILSTRLLTEVAAEAGRWPLCAEAAELSLDAVEMAAAGMDVSRWADWLERNQGVAALGAYAAAKLGDLTRAVTIVERGCGVIAAGRITQQRTSLAAATDAGHGAAVATYVAAVDRVRFALAGGPPGDRTDLRYPFGTTGPLLRPDDLTTVAGRSAESDLAAAIEELATARRDLVEAVPTLRPAATPDELLAFVEETGEQLTYLISTAVGGAALSVRPGDISADGVCRVPDLALTWLPSLDASRVDALIERVHSSPSEAVDLEPAAGVRGLSRGPDAAEVHGVLEDLADLLDDGAYRRPGHLVTVGQLALLPVCAAWRSVDGRAIPVGTAGSGLLHVTAWHNARARSAAWTRISAITNPRPCHSGGQALPDLPYATDEGEFLAEEFGAEHLDGAAATFERFVQVLRDGSLSILHVAAHGWTSDRDVDQVRLLLVDGPDGVARTVSVTDLPNRLPCSTVFLACCWSARTSARLPDECVGFATSLVQAGAGCVIAPLWPIDDHAAFRVSTAFYRHLLDAGRSPRTALAAARDDVARQAISDRRLRPRERADLRAAADAFVLVGG